jgi:hypothetical protein
MMQLALGGITRMASGLAVDLALVLAVDCSSSVDAGDFHLQMHGIAAALRNPALLAAIAAGPSRQIALTLLQWSNRDGQVISVPWRLISSRSDIEAVATEVEEAERRWRPGGTGLAAAIDFSIALLQTLPLAARRLAIDVSGDGEDNEGGEPALSRDIAVALGITINGLPILHGSPTLERYYRDRVTGGPGSFIVRAEYIRSFRDAMARKLLREVTGERLY